MSKKIVLSFEQFKRFAGSGSVELIKFLTNQRIGKVEFTSKPWDWANKTDHPELKKRFGGQRITKWVVDLQKGLFLKLINGKQNHSEKQSVGELIGEIRDLISNAERNGYSSVAIYRRNGPIKAESNLNESIQTGDLPETINDGWKNGLPNKTIPLETKTIPVKIFKDSTHPREKKLLSAFKASLKHKVGYIVTPQNKLILWDKNYIIETMPMFYVFAVDEDTCKITRFKIGDPIKNKKTDVKMNEYGRKPKAGVQNNYEKEIAQKTGARESAVKQWLDMNEVDPLTILQGIGSGRIKRNDFTDALMSDNGTLEFLNKYNSDGKWSSVWKASPKHEGKLPMKNIQKLKKMIREAVLKENLNRPKRKRKNVMSESSLPSDPLKSYLTTALWSSNDESDESGGDPFDANYDISDIAPKSVAQSKKDLADFIKQAKAAGLLQEFLKVSDLSQFAHYFWLVRNGHGAGFFDMSELDDEVEKPLTKMAEKFREVTPILGDDGKIYFE